MRARRDSPYGLLIRAVHAGFVRAPLTWFIATGRSSSVVLHVG
ncbi:hypothetical protein HMPREF9577_02014 [Cutibacterium acnes HL110PA3]|nr:hypothetical protein HMPREF9577_02014 [Cutibacterium acnes HL110PA3]